MGSCSPLGEEGLGAPFLSSHPPPLVRAPLVPASIYSTTTSKPPIHLPPSTSSTVPVSLCTSSCASSHLPACPTLLSAFSTLHPQPCSRPILPLGPPLGSTTTHCTALCAVRKVYFSAQPNNLKLILNFDKYYPIEHIFVPACSSARKIHFFKF